MKSPSVVLKIRSTQVGVGSSPTFGTQQDKSLPSSLQQVLQGHGAVALLVAGCVHECDDPFLGDELQEGQQVALVL